MTDSQNLLKLPGLKPGDKIAVISPAGPIAAKRLNAGIGQLRKWGFSVVLGKYTGGRHFYLSSPDKARSEDLTNAFLDPEVKALLCSRGGYGSGRLLHNFPFSAIADNPKIFVGFSDTTALNWALFARSRLVTFSGPTVGEIGAGLPQSSVDSFFNSIGMEKGTDYLYDGQINTVRSGTASGRLFPGCLSLIVTLLGTPYLPDLTGAILLIEEINEKPYRIDRMITHLKNAGILKQISALLVGQMINCWPRTPRRQHLPLEDILFDLTKDNPIPIYTGFPYGHSIDRITVPVGVHAEISSAGLKLLESPLS
ncbi:hypothetical protein CEE37_06265 [candidate division LCP-89 bacterium B3_LCP]|uniref:LD-carboxypeptidase n=1 Tax=candidate division LCP-89 bacterium B3_LCP TaxID=2012998 RepID=A0A532V277_UNCL8|nr:MAG: hypothetical protein CEE37_06265 [candidate division LCP-89 bacterium B3_LCP]